MPHLSVVLSWCSTSRLFYLSIPANSKLNAHPTYFLPQYLILQVFSILQNNKWDFFIFLCMEVVAMVLAAGVTFHSNNPTLALIYFMAGKWGIWLVFVSSELLV